MMMVDTTVYLLHQLSILLFDNVKKEFLLDYRKDSLPLLECIASSKQVDLRNTIVDLKQNLIDGEVSLYSWIDNKSMTADVLTKEGEEIENI